MYLSHGPYLGLGGGWGLVYLAPLLYHGTYRLIKKEKKSIVMSGRNMYMSHGIASCSLTEARVINTTESMDMNFTA